MAQRGNAIVTIIEHHDAGGCHVELRGRLDVRTVADLRLTLHRLIADGTTPVLLPDILPGFHVVRVQLAAHQEWISTVQVVPDDRNRVTAALEEDEAAHQP